MKNMASPSMLRQHPSFESSPIEDANMNSKSPYACYNGGYQYPRNGHENLVYVMPSDSNENQNGSQSNGGEPVTKNAGSRWREDETESLVEIWRDKICQTRWWKQSKGVRVNKEMWEEIAHLLAEREVFRTPAQCQIRMKNLLQFYRQTIDSRRSEKSWEDLPEYFDIVDKIMTRKETAGGGGMGTPNLSDAKSYSPGSQTMSPPKLHNEKVYEEENERVEEMEEERKINTNKRKSSVRSTEEFNEHPELDHGKLYYPPASSSSSNCHPPPRKIPAYTMKSEYGTNNPYHSSPSLHSSFSRMHRGEPCSGSCCTKPSVPYSSRSSSKSSKDKDFNKEPLETPSDLPSLEQYKMIPPPSSAQMMNLQSEPPNKGGESRNHPCNYYTPPQGQQQPPPPPPHHYRHNYIQLYRGGVAATADGYAKNAAQTHMMFNQDLLQLQYKQMKTLIEIEKKRLEIEEGRMREEKEANYRTSAFLLEAVKILAETFRKENNSNNNNNTETDYQKQQNSPLSSKQEE